MQARRWCKTLAALPLCVALSRAGAASAEETQADGEEHAPKASCVEVKVETPYIAGYNHIVVLHSRCERAMRCRVSTDVNPDEQTVPIKPTETTRVLTFRGSPARTFTPLVSCEPSR